MTYLDDNILDTKLYNYFNDMDKEYSQKWFHVKGMIFPGSLFLLIVSFFTGLIVKIIKSI